MIVALMGGLANQLFGWAFGISVAAQKKEELLFTRFRVDNDIKRSYSLGAFDINPVFTTYETHPIFHDSGCFNPNVYYAPSSTTYFGYWQTEKYFNDPLVRKSLMLRNEPSEESKQIADEMRNSRSCFIHVRRGDYVKEPHTAKFHGNLNMEYYQTAMGLIQLAVSETKFFVFSDDPEWCRANFPNCVVIGHNKPGDGLRPGKEHEDLWLMSQAQHAILANSAFSWWGSWLGDEKQNRMVIAPKKWFQEIEQSDLIPDRWMKI